MNVDASGWSTSQKNLKYQGVMVIKPRSQCERCSVIVTFPRFCVNVPVWSVNWSVAGLADRSRPFLGGHRAPTLISRLRDGVPTSGVFFSSFRRGHFQSRFLTGFVNAELCSVKE